MGHCVCVWGLTNNISFIICTYIYWCWSSEVFQSKLLWIKNIIKLPWRSYIPILDKPMEDQIQSRFSHAGLKLGWVLMPCSMLPSGLFLPCALLSRQSMRLAGAINPEGRRIMKGRRRRRNGIVSPDVDPKSSSFPGRRKEGGYIETFVLLAYNPAQQ